MDERKDIKGGVANELKKFFCKVSIYLGKGKEGLVHYSKVLTIKSDISLLKNDRRVVYRKVGEDAYKAIKEGRIDLPESKDAIEKIDRIEDSIKEKTQEIEKLGEEGHSRLTEKEIIKTEEVVEVKKNREEKAWEVSPIIRKKASPEKENKDVIEKLEQEAPSLNVEKEIKETNEEVEIKEEKEEKAQKKPSKTARKTTSGKKKKTRKTPTEKNCKEERKQRRKE